MTKTELESYMAAQAAEGTMSVRVSLPAAEFDALIAELGSDVFTKASSSDVVLYLHQGIIATIVRV